MSSDTTISNDGLYLNPILVQGKAKEGINNYRAWPLYNTNDSMMFHGCEDWNARAEQMNQQNPNVVYSKPNDESVVDITRRMMMRLVEGTTKK